MASIIKRRKEYSVVYRFVDEQGNERQKWETFAMLAEAKKRKLEVEFKQENNEFFAPTTKTINDLLSEYMSIYGLNAWAFSTYESRQALISNYISPLIGDVLLDDVTPRMMDILPGAADCEIRRKQICKASERVCIAAHCARDP